MRTDELIEALDRGELDRRPVEAEGLRFTSLDREMWPGTGLTKGDLVRYYVEIAEVMLRYLDGRPLMLKRYPHGLDGRGIVQQRVGPKVPDSVRTAVLPTAEGEPKTRFIGARSTLLYASQMDTIEFHAWHSVASSPDRPDWIVLDLDPSRGAGFKKVVRVARLLGARLEELGLAAGIKTSGSRGLHIYVPTGRKVDYETSASFAKALAEEVASTDPGIATVERTVNRRGYRVYVDHLQNARGKTAAAPYTLRARPGAPVSMPIHWDEVDETLDPRGFRLPDVPGRLRSMGDAWEGLFQRPAGDITRALEVLAG